MSNSDDPLELLRFKQIAQLSLRSFERRYFSEVDPVSSLEFVFPDNPVSPSSYDPNSRTILLNQSIVVFPTLAQILILHELVHHKLFVLDPTYAQRPYGEIFQEEIRELIKRRAYDKLL